MSNELPREIGDSLSVPSPSGAKQRLGVSQESRSNLLRWFNGNPFDRCSESFDRAQAALDWCEANADIYYLNSEMRSMTLRGGAKAVGVSTDHLFKLINSVDTLFESNKPHSLIAFEGIDGAGKTFQLGLLESYLRNCDPDVKAYSCPNYDGFFGLELAKMLAGNETVSAANLDPKSMALWYALDRKQLTSDINSTRTGRYILFNRYTLSSAVYQSVRSANGIVDWVFELEHTHLDIPCPDLYIILDVSPALSQDNVSQRQRALNAPSGLDVYEKSRSLLEAARERYRALASEYSWIELIDCMVDERKMKPAERIHEQVLECLSRHHLLPQSIKA